MAPERITAAHFSPDTREFILQLHRHGVRYLLVGGEAVIFYGHVRLTGDVDVFYDSAKENAERLFAALRAFWSGDVPGIRDATELTEQGAIVQFGRPPNRIDLINRIDGVAFAEAWPARLEAILDLDAGPVPLPYIGLGDLIRNKEASGRPRDLDDLQFLRASQGR